MSPSASPSPVILVNEVSHTYGRRGPEALKRVSLSVPKGSCFGLLGPNGAGKSTLLSLMTGVLRPQTGSIEISGTSVSQNLSDVRACSALVPQDYAFYPELTGRQNLKFFAGLHRLTATEWEERLAHCTEICDLSGVLDQAAETYSGGLKRRLNFAIGLLSDPDILYLDEPTVGIDALSRKTIIAGIQRLTDSGKTVIYTSHYMEEVEAICDHVAIIAKGQLVADASMADLLARTQQKILHLELAEPVPAEATALITHASGSLHHGRAELPLQNPADLPDLLTKLQAAGCAPSQVRYGDTRLEQIYLDLLAGKELA